MQAKITLSIAALAIALAASMFMTGPSDIEALQDTHADHSKAAQTESRRRLCMEKNLIKSDWQAEAICKAKSEKM